MRANKSALMQWEWKYWFACGRMNIFRNRRGSVGSLGTYNINFPTENCFFRRVLRSWWTNGSAGKAKNNEFPAGECLSLETKHGWLEAREHNISIFHQENIWFELPHGGAPSCHMLTRIVNAKERLCSELPLVRF